MTALQANLNRMQALRPATVVLVHPVDRATVDAFLDVGADRVVVATCDAGVLAALRHAFANDRRVNIFDALLAPQNGESRWLRFNVTDVNGMMAPLGLSRFYPRLKLLERMAVRSRAIGEWLDALEIRPEAGRANVLVMDCPGYELPLLHAAGAKRLGAFQRVVLRTVRDGLLEAGSAHGEAATWLADHSYTLDSEDLESDPCFPLSVFAFNADDAARRELQRRCNDLERRLGQAEQAHRACELQLRSAAARAADVDARLVMAAEERDAAKAEVEAMSAARSEAEQLAAQKERESAELAASCADHRRQLDETSRRAAALDAELLDVLARHDLMKEELLKAEAQVDLLSRLLTVGSPDAHR